MDLGKDQFNTFSTFILDCWKEWVYYEEQKFPAGYFATEILNFAGEAYDPILERIITITNQVDRAVQAGRDKGCDVLAELTPLMKETVTWIYTCPPFCYQQSQRAWSEFDRAMDADQFRQDWDDTEEHLPFIFLLFSESVLKILVAIYNFCLLIRTFEKHYLRRLSKRTESTFAKAAHKCFDEGDGFLTVLEQMPFGEIEEFFFAPRLILQFHYMQDPSDRDEWIAVQQVVCNRLIDFYVFDLMNGMQHGNAPSQCRGCGRYFLTTNRRMPKYCDGVAPQNSRMTCRQYGAMMQQKEQNKQHPVYRLFTTRTNTIRKHHQRGKISDELRREALYLAETYRDRALMDNDYAANGYAQDMEQDHVYAEAEKRLK